MKRGFELMNSIGGKIVCDNEPYGNTGCGVFKGERFLAKNQL